MLLMADNLKLRIPIESLVSKIGWLVGCFSKLGQGHQTPAFLITWLI